MNFAIDCPRCNTFGVYTKNGQRFTCQLCDTTGKINLYGRSMALVLNPMTAEEKINFQGRVIDKLVDRVLWAEHRIDVLYEK